MSSVRTIIPALAVLLVATLGLRAQEQGEGPAFLSASEILLALESSKTTYSVRPISADSLKRFAHDIMFPQQSPRHICPMVVRENGAAEVVPYPFDSLELTMLNDAGKLFKEERFDEARAGYEALLKLRPRCYLALCRVGDCYYFPGDLATALRYYDSALAMNPNDYQLHYFRANTLMKLKRADDALEAYTTTLVLNPRHFPTLEVLRQIGGEHDIEVRESLFAPQGVAYRSGDEVVIGLPEDEATSGWMVYAMAKGLWLGEPSHRMKMIGQEEYVWTSMEEQESLIALLESYLTLKSKDEGAVDPDLERLFEISVGGELLPFILYEIGSRMDPHITLRVDNDTRRRVHDYVASHIIVRKKG